MRWSSHPARQVRGAYAHRCPPDPQVNLRLAWIQFSSCIVAGAFVFANSIRTIYESVVFLFVVHPFDVGDGILIGTGLDYYIVSPQSPAPLPSSLPLLASVQVCDPDQNQHPVVASLPTFGLTQIAQHAPGAR